MRKYMLLCFIYMSATTLVTQAQSLVMNARIVAPTCRGQSLVVRVELMNSGKSTVVIDANQLGSRIYLDTLKKNARVPSVAYERGADYFPSRHYQPRWVVLKPKEGFSSELLLSLEDEAFFRQGNRFRVGISYQQNAALSDPKGEVWIGAVSSNNVSFPLSDCKRPAVRPQAQYSTQIAQTPQVSYLTTDHLGSPRVITDQLGAVTNRKDFSAFGEETITAQRTSGLKYQPDNIRQDYTGYQKDDESGLEFAQARYYNAGHGRFTSVDPLTASASIRNPQTFNRYSYVLNSPYKFVDPLGLLSSSTGACGQWCPGYSSSSWSGIIPFDSLEGRGGQVLQSAKPPPPPPDHEAQHNAEPPPAPTAEENAEPSVFNKFTVILAYGESGSGDNNLGENLKRAALTRGVELEAQGFAVIYAPISTKEGFQGVLDTAAQTYYPTVGIELWAHGANDRIYIGTVTSNSNKILMEDVKNLKNSSKTLSYIRMHSCYTGKRDDGIAAALANQLKITVYAPTEGTIFSSKPDRITHRGIFPNKGPAYLIPDGGSWRKFPL